MSQQAETSSADYIWPVEKFEDLTVAQRTCARDIIDAFHEAMKFDNRAGLHGQHEELPDEVIFPDA